MTSGELQSPGMILARRTGLVLVIVVGVLGVLAVLGTAFVPLASIERRASQQRIHASRAYLLARSGLEDALARLDAGQDPETEDGSLQGLASLEHYAVHLEREGGFYVNGGAPEDGAMTGYNAVLRRMLGTLAKALDEEEGGIDADPVEEADGWALLDQRPREGWKDWNGIRALLGPAKFAALNPYLTLHAWEDRRVIQPNVPAGLEGTLFERQSDRLLAHPSPDFQRSVGGRILGRAPVDFDWARRRRPALLALIGGLKGLYLHQFGRNWLGSLRPMEARLTWTSTDDAHVAADFIATWTSPVRSWPEFTELCGKIPYVPPLAHPIVVAQDREAFRDLLLAQFNPNTGLNKFNPSDVRWKRLDKSDLLVYSTELALSPVCSRKISSRGRVLDANGRLLASRELTAVLAPPGVLRLSTQRELLCEDLGNPQFPGDEGPARLPGTASFISESHSLASIKTWGHRLTGAGWMDGDSNGASLQAYPEPYVSPTPSRNLSIRPSDVDGYLETATLETPERGDLGFLARFDDGFDLDIARGGLTAVTEDVQLLRPDELGHSIWDPFKPSTLFPDGAYSERERTPAYFDKGSIPGKHAMIAFWVKHLGRRTGEGPLVHATNYLETPYSTGINQFFMIAATVGKATTGWSIIPRAHFELGHDPAADPNGEFQFNRPCYGYPVRLWHHLGFYYDFEAPTKNETGELILDLNLAASQSYFIDDPSPLPTTPSSELTTDDLLGLHRIALGGKHPGTPDDIPEDTENPHYGGAQATLDEFAVYDFGQSEAAAAPFAFRRYQDGRYYKGSAYDGLGGPLDEEAPQYFSPRLSLPAGSRIRRVDWTFLAPQALEEDYLETALVSEDASRYLDVPDASRSIRQAGWTEALQSWSTRLSVRAPFRLQAVFRRREGSPTVTADLPILDPPGLDDLTVVTEPPGGPAVLAWDWEP